MIKKNCKYCGVEFEVHPYRKNTAKFHCEQCREDWKKGKTYEEIYGISNAQIMKEKQSQIRKNCKVWNTGLTKETDERMARIAKNVSSNAKINPYYGHTGKPHSEQTKETMRIKRANRIYPLKDTTIEIKIQSFLKMLGIEYYSHFYIKGIQRGYQCDILIPSMNIVIECDGDYWHSNPLIYSINNMSPRQIKQRQDDEIRNKELVSKGYRVIRLWEHDIKVMDLNKFQEIIKNE